LQLYPSSLAVLIESLKKLPGIGAKTAQRLAIHLLHAPKGEAEGLARAILDAREKIFFCSVCGNLTDKDPCDLCRDERRDQSLLCVVEWPLTEKRKSETRGQKSERPDCLGQFSAPISFSNH
jgi:recombination protein RecR